MCNPVEIQWVKYATYMKMLRIDHRIRKNLMELANGCQKNVYHVKFKMAAMK